MFLSRGHAYVYFTYGSCFMLNVASEAHGIGAGVLLRAVEPLEGIETMQRLRGVTRILDLTRGPGASGFRATPIACGASTSAAIHS